MLKPSSVDLTRATGSLDGGRLISGSVDGSVKLADASVVDAKIASGLDGTKVTHGVLNGLLLGTTTVQDTALASGIDASKLTHGALDGSLLAGGSVAAAAIAAHSLTNTQLATSGISASILTTGTLDGSLLGASSVANAALATGIDGAKLSAGTVGNTALASGIDASKVTTGTLGGAVVVDGGNISTGTVAAARLGAGYLTSSLSGTISNSQLASGIDAGKITTGTLGASVVVDGGNISTGTVAAARLGSGYAASALSGTINLGTQVSGSLALSSLAAGALPTGAGAVTVSDGNIVAGAAIALSKLGTGALASGITINNANWSGTALADANLASGITGSKISGNLSNANIDPVRINPGALPTGASAVTVADGNFTGTLSLSKLAAGAIPATTTVNNGNWSGTALALANLATGALPSGITINNGNWSGTALALANLATGALPSGVTINNANWSGTALSNANLASGIDPSKLTGAGTVPLLALSGITTTQLAAAANVKGSQLETFMRMACRYEAAYDLYLPSGNAIPFGNKVFDGQAQFSGTFNGSNLLLQSEAFDNASWSKSGTGVAAPTVTANAIVAPDGNATAESISLPSVGASQASVCLQSGTVSAVPYTFSCWLKCASGNVTVYLMVWNGSTYYERKCVLTTAWQRFWFTTPNLTAATWNIAVGVNCLDPAQSTTLGAQTFHAWGAQLEANATTPGPYVQTTTTTKSAQPSTYGATNYLYTPAASGPVRVEARVRLTGVNPGQGVFVFLYDNTAGAIVSTGPMCESFTDIAAVSPDGTNLMLTDVIDAVLKDSIQVTAGHTYSLFWEGLSSWHVNVISAVGGNWVSVSAWVRGDSFDRSLTYLQPGCFIDIEPIAQ